MIYHSRSTRLLSVFEQNCFFWANNLPHFAFESVQRVAVLHGFNEACHGYNPALPELKGTAHVLGGFQDEYRPKRRCPRLCLRGFVRALLD